MKDVQPFIKSSTKSAIYKLSYITGKTVKQICNELCQRMFNDKKRLVEELSPYAKWDMKIEGITYTASATPIKTYPISGSLERVTIKVDPSSYSFANSLSHLLGWTVAKVVAYCIERAMNDFEFINQYITDLLEANTKSGQKNTLKGIMKDINEALDEEHSIPALLIGIADELKSIDQNYDEALCQFAEKW